MLHLPKFSRVRHATVTTHSTYDTASTAYEGTPHVYDAAAATSTDAVGMTLVGCTSK